MTAVSRTAFDLLTVSESARSTSIAVTASDSLSTVARFTAGNPAATTANVSIMLGSTDVTNSVEFESAHFSQRVNGNPGEAYMRVRDLASSFTVTEGADWLVIINGEAAWRGFVTQVTDTYIYPAGNVAESGLTRFVDLRGADQNVLLTKRVVFKKSDPANVTGAQFPPNTDDTTAITELLANWLDLSSDNLDTTSGVTHVGSLDPSQTTRAWSGGWYWKDAMASIGMLPAAIWYIRPETGSPKGTLCYVDVDVPTSPFGLSDQPNGTTTKGFREAEIVLDGTSLANDVMAWGMGYGSTVPVFKRAIASGSVTDHGLWQQGVITNGVYKQGTIDRIATSIIDGSPSSHRGAKNDRPYVRLVTYEPGLLAGHVVNFTSAIWDYSDAIPVRELDLTFESPTNPRYEIVLSHEIDAPWSDIDLFRILTPQFPFPTIPRPPVPPGLPQPGNDCQGGLTDTFTRTVAETTHLSNSGTTFASIGTADCGLAWTGLNLGGGPFTLSNGGIGAAVNGSSLVLRGIWNSGSSLHGGDAFFFLPFTIAMDHSATKSFTFRMASLPLNGSGVRIAIPGGAPSGSKTANIYANPSGASGATSYIGFTTTTSDSTAIPNGYWVAGTTYAVTLIDNGTDTVISVTDGTTTYTRTSSGYTGSTIQNPALGTNWDTVLPVSHTDSVSIFIDTLIIPEIDKCSTGNAGPDDTVPVVPQGPTGYGCEQPARLTSTTYKTSRRYQSGATFVWVEGLLQERGRDYTENSDHRTLTFSDSIDSTFFVTVCYFGEVTM